ncbi:MAG: transcription elongation factor GreA [Phycisphaerae bacterium]|nr:transcription elongation factor GreA [Phycisphaerae bacterium]
MFDLVPISITGFNKLKEELSRLEKERAEVSKRVGEAREMGDLRENGEYIYGRQHLGFIDGRLGELRTQINRSEKIDCTKVQCDRAVFGTIVTLLNLNTQEKVTYQLLGPNDADLDTGSISVYSPVGDAVHGLAIGEKTLVKSPRGESHFEVIDIAKSQIE